jgi:hypothetical protein
MGQPFGAIDVHVMLNNLESYSSACAVAPLPVVAG